MNLSHDAREAIKTALAMTIAYGVGLQMGWDRPYWAGFAVAFVSLANVGQSINKATLRMLGSIVGAIVALLLIGLFAQQRWLFIGFLTLWFAICTYMNTGNRHQYFWFVSAFVCLIIAADGGPQADDAFNMAMLRLQQTGLGILAYSLVAILLWPNNSQQGLETAVRKHANNQLELFDASLRWLDDDTQGAAVKDARAAEISGLTQFATLLDSALTDSEEIREARDRWRAYQRATGKFAEELERWRESLDEFRHLPASRILPGIDAFAVEQRSRLAAIVAMTSGTVPTLRCQEISLAANHEELGQLSHFDRAALLVSRQHLLQLDKASRLMFDNSLAILGVEELPPSPRENSISHGPWVPDPDRLLAAGKIMLMLWLAFLSIIYISDFPGGTGFVAMCGPLGIVLCSTPQLSVRLLFVPTAVGICIASGLYIFVMPQLSSFAGLGTMLFLATFGFCYRYASPEKALGRALGLAMLVSIISVSNQQSYHFLSAANTALMFPLLFILVSVVSLIPYASRPERAVLKLMGRYFRSAEYLLSQGANQNQTLASSYRDSFHRQELASLPAKLGAWIAHVDPSVLGDESVKTLPGLVNSLQALSYRLQEVLEVRQLPQSLVLSAELEQDMLSWRENVLRAMQKMSGDTGHREPLERARLDSTVAALEQKIRQCLDDLTDSGLSVEEQQNFYRLIGAYRGLSQTLLDFAEKVANVDWTPCYRERFA